MRLIKIYYTYGHKWKVAKDQRHLDRIISGLKGVRTKYADLPRAHSSLPLGYSLFNIEDLDADTYVEFE